MEGIYEQQSKKTKALSAAVFDVSARCDLPADQQLRADGGTCGGVQAVQSEERAFWKSVERAEEL